jgi:hypothetical protein
MKEHKCKGLTGNENVEIKESTLNCWEMIVYDGGDVTTTEIKYCPFCGQNLDAPEVEPMGYDSLGHPSGVVVRGDAAQRLLKELEEKENPKLASGKLQRKVFEELYKFYQGEGNGD